MYMCSMCVTVCAENNLWNLVVILIIELGNCIQRERGFPTAFSIKQSAM